MMRNVSVEYHSNGLIIGQDGLDECVTVPNFLKYQFYEEMLIACLNGGQVLWSDLNGNKLLMNYEYKDHFICFLNGMFIGDMVFIPLSETSIAIPVETEGTFDYFEVYDSSLVECYLLEKEEVLRLTNK